MKRSNQIKNFILIPLLIIQLVAFNFSALPVFAEEVTTVETGDAAVEVDVENNVNSSATTTGESDLEGDNLEGGSSSEEEGNQEEVDEQEQAGGEEGQTSNENPGDNSGDETNESGEDPSENGEGGDGDEELTGENEEEAPALDVSNDNEAELENDIEAEADTGSNSADDNSGHAIVETGDADVGVNLVNIVNTNIIGSDFEFILSNFLDDVVGDINLNDLGITIIVGCGIGVEECLSSLKASNQNEGAIDNDMEISAVTGNNSASGNEGVGLVRTGNASVAANIVNLLNSNIIGSGWAMVFLNIAADLKGDLIFPAEEAFEGFLGSGSSGLPSGVQIENSSQAVVENSVDIIADTGGNAAQNNNGGSLIDTGNAQTAANVMTIANTNILASNWVYMTVNVSGSWDGNIFSLPDGLSANELSTGILISGGGTGAGTSFANNALHGGNNSLDIANNNTGTIRNNLRIYALTGGNSVCIIYVIPVIFKTINLAHIDKIRSAGQRQAVCYHGRIRNRS